MNTIVASETQNRTCEDFNGDLFYWQEVAEHVGNALRTDGIGSPEESALAYHMQRLASVICHPSSQEGSYYLTFTGTEALETGGLQPAEILVSSDYVSNLIGWVRAGLRSRADQRAQQALQQRHLSLAA